MWFDDPIASYVICICGKYLVFAIIFSVPNYASEVYGEGSICVEVNATEGDCLPLGGTPRCYQREVVQKPTTDQLGFSIKVGGKQICSILKTWKYLHTYQWQIGGGGGGGGGVIWFCGHPL